MRQQVAFDRGYGSRCVSYNRDNPYPETDADSRAAWFAGWDNADAELTASNAKMGGAA